MTAAYPARSTALLLQFQSLELAHALAFQAFTRILITFASHAPEHQIARPAILTVGMYSAFRADAAITVNSTKTEHASAKSVTPRQPPPPEPIACELKWFDDPMKKHITIEVSVGKYWLGFFRINHSCILPKTP